MTSQILKSVYFTKTQKSRYLENETWFLLQMKEFISYMSRAIQEHIKVIIRTIPVRITVSCSSVCVRLCHRSAHMEAKRSSKHHISSEYVLIILHPHRTG